MHHRVWPARALVLALGALLLGAEPAVAQVNVETLRSKLPDEGIGASLSGSMATYVGNAQGLSLGGETLVAARVGRHLGYFNASASYVRFGGEEQVSKSFAHLRHNFRIAAGMFSEAFAQIERDRFRRLASRSLFGLGPRVAVASTESFQLFTGLSLMAEHNRLAEDTRPVRPDWVLRISSYAAAVFAVDGERASVSNTLYFQPKADEWSDTRLLNTLGLQVRFAGHLTVGLSATLRYESPTVSGVKGLDLSVQNSLGVVY